MDSEFSGKHEQKPAEFDCMKTRRLILWMRETPYSNTWKQRVSTTHSLTLAGKSAVKTLTASSTQSDSSSFKHRDAVESSVWLSRVSGNRKIHLNQQLGRRLTSDRTSSGSLCLLNEVEEEQEHFTGVTDTGEWAWTFSRSTVTVTIRVYMGLNRYVSLINNV